MSETKPDNKLQDQEGSSKSAAAPLAIMPEQSSALPVQKEEPTTLQPKPFLKREERLNEAIAEELAAIAGYNKLNEDTAKKYLQTSERVTFAAFIMLLVSILLFCVLALIQTRLIAIIAPVSTVVGSVLLQFLGKSYWAMSQQSWEQINHFYDSKQRILDSMIAEDFCSAITTETERNKILGQLALKAMTQANPTARAKNVPKKKKPIKKPRKPPAKPQP
jgi:hypothetical protein